MDRAALPRSAQHLRDRLLEALMGVGDHQLHPSQAAADQRAEELPPERLGLGRTHVQADDLALAGLVDAVGDHRARCSTRPPARTFSSRPPHNRDTWSLLTPASPRASTSRSTLQVETPLT